jgi:hypothetical protein
LRDVIATHHKCVTEIVLTFGGFVLQYLENGVLVYSGYLEAHVGCRAGGAGQAGIGGGRRGA